MSTDATLERKAIESMKMLPESQGKKNLVIVGVFVLGAAALAYWMNSDSTQEPPPRHRGGSDQADLTGPRARTGLTVIGTVTINQQFPLGVGCVVAYEETMTHAIAYSPLDKMGNYKLEDVTPGKLVLLVKREITDDLNPINAEINSRLGAPGRSRDKMVGAQPGSLMKKSGPSRPGGEAAKLLDRPPSKESLKKIKFDVSTPEFENVPEVQWMINVAFEKFDHASKKNQRFIVPPGEGERRYIIDLPVP